MLKIYLARHGQDFDNADGILNGHRDEPLTVLGRKQAGELSKKIKEAGIRFDKIYSAPLKRTYQTAEIIADALTIDRPELLEELIERDFGVMTGRPVKDIESMCAPDIIKTEAVTYFLSPEGAETFPQLLKRGCVILDKINITHSDGNILLVTSGDIGKMIYAVYYNLDWKKTLSLFNFGQSDLLLLSPDSPPEKAHVFK
ncbi:MAG: histidine phosphatase family protein [Patescibacteria group bacterium]|jgi:probable phosphoglycerate mutase